MTNTIARYHLVMDKFTFLKRKREGKFNGFYNNLSYAQTEATLDKFLTLLYKVGAPWDWNHIGKYNDFEYLRHHLEKPTTKLFYLLDNMKVIGYSLIINPNQESFKILNEPYPSIKQVIEIENLGLFPSQAGSGKGGKFFEMIMDDLFKNNDYVYWSMSSTNHPSLLKYYTEKLGMRLIGTNYVEDFRPTKSNQKVA